MLPDKQVGLVTIEQAALPLEALLHPDNLARQLTQLGLPGGRHHLGDGSSLHQHQGHGLTLDIQYLQPQLLVQHQLVVSLLGVAKGPAHQRLPGGVPVGEQGAIEGEGLGQAFGIPAIQGRRSEQVEVHLLAERFGVGQRQLGATGAATKPLLALDRLAAETLGDGPLELLEPLAQGQQLTGQHQLLVTVEAGELADHLQQGGAGGLVVPEAILEQQQIQRGDLVATVEEGARLDEPDRLLPAPIRHIAAVTELAVELLAQLVDELETGVGQAHLLDLRLPGLVLLPPDLHRGRQVLVGLAITRQHGLEVGFLLHPVHPDPHQHAIVERLQPAVRGGQLVRCGHQQPHGNGMLAVAVAELPLVDGGEQGVEDGRARLPDLVEKHHLGLRQVAVSQPQVLAILLERLDGEGTEHLLRRAEAGHQVFEVAGIVKGELEAPRDQALGDARGAQQEDALATQGRQQAEPQGVLALIQPLPEGGQQPWQALMDGGGTNSILG